MNTKGKTMRGFVRGLLVIGTVVLVVAIWQRSPAPGVPALLPAPAVSPGPTLAPSPSTSPAPSAIVTAGCDEIDELFARMFVGLTEAALTGSGTPPEEFAAAIAADREILRRYLEVLDIPVDDAWLDAVMSPDLDRRLLGQCLD